MKELVKLAQALLGPAVPVAAIAGIALALGRFLDAHLKTRVRDAYIAYLRHGGLEDHSHAVVDAAADAVNVIFGPRHLSWRCFLASALVTAVSITVLIVLSGIFHLWIGADLDGPLLEFLKAYWFATPGVRLQGALTWLIWSVLVDYLSLYKTRLVIKALRKHARWGLLICAGDFVVGFAVYVAGVTILSLLPVVLGLGWIMPPAISFELAMAFTFIVVWWGQAHVPGLEAALIQNGLKPEQVGPFLHGDATQTALAMVFLVQAVPFITIGSDLFYASMMPSIWLWLFVASVFLAKAISWTGAYLQFTLGRFKKPSQTLGVTGGLLIPVVITVIYVVTLTPYVLAGLVFVAQAILKAVGALANHLPPPVSPR